MHTWRAIYDKQHELTGPSAPTLTVTAVDHQSFNFTIFPLSEPSQCVLHYNITPKTSDGLVLPGISIESGGSVTATASGYDVCNITYSFTAVAVTSASPGERSIAINSDFLSKYTVFLHQIVCTIFCLNYVDYQLRA
jgi:hypothetical protein